MMTSAQLVAFVQTVAADALTNLGKAQQQHVAAKEKLKVAKVAAAAALNADSEQWNEESEDVLREAGRAAAAAAAAGDMVKDASLELQEAQDLCRQLGVLASGAVTRTPLPNSALQRASGHLDPAARATNTSPSTALDRSSARPRAAAGSRPEPNPPTPAARQAQPNPPSGQPPRATAQDTPAILKPAGAQPRSKWTDHDTNLLIKAWQDTDKYDAKYSRIQQDIQNGVIPMHYHGYSQANIRDKLRLTKTSLLVKDGILPAGFDRIRLDKAYVKRVEKAGRNPHRKEADIENGKPTRMEYEASDAE